MRCGEVALMFLAALACMLLQACASNSVAVRSSFYKEIPQGATVAILQSEQYLLPVELSEDAPLLDDSAASLFMLSDRQLWDYSADAHERLKRQLEEMGFRVVSMFDSPDYTTDLSLAAGPYGWNPVTKANGPFWAQHFGFRQPSRMTITIFKDLSLLDIQNYALSRDYWQNLPPDSLAKLGYEVPDSLAEKGAMWTFTDTFPSKLLTENLFWCADMAFASQTLDLDRRLGELVEILMSAYGKTGTWNQKIKPGSPGK